MRQYGNYFYLCPFQTRIPMENETQETQPKVNTTHCLNCGAEFEGKFCPECGQSAETGRFTIRFIIENLQAALIGKDGGIWFTFKNMFTRPGSMIVEILNGKRKKYFSPFPLLFFTLTMFILIYSYTGSREYISKSKSIVEQTKVEKDETKYQAENTVYQALVFYNNHYTACYLLSLPLITTAAWISFGKRNRKRYYWAEYVVAIVYTMTFVVLYRILESLVFLASPDVSDYMVTLLPLANMAAFAVCFRKMMGFSILGTILRSVLTYALYILMIALLALTTTVVLAVYYAILH